MLALMNSSGNCWCTQLNSAHVSHNVDKRREDKGGAGSAPLQERAVPGEHREPGRGHHCHAGHVCRISSLQ